MRSLLPYAYDYISLLMEDDNIRNYTRNIILFGSAARGDADKHSDVDIFIDTPPEAASMISPAADKALRRFDVTFGRKWSAVGIKNTIKIIVGSLEEERWRDLKAEMASYGAVLYGGFEARQDGLAHFALFSYSLSRTLQKRKMRLLRSLFGYSTRIDNKTYRKAGFIEEIGGVKLGSNSFLAPVGRSRDVQRIFTAHGVTPEIREVWIRQ